jgi:hypothetical protein
MGIDLKARGMSAKNTVDISTNTAALAQMSNHITFTEQSSAPATPTSGNQEVYFLNDGKMYTKDDTGVITQLTGSAAWTDFAGSAVLAWGGATPDEASVDVFKYRIINGILFYNISIYASDGNNATSVSISTPVSPTGYAFVVVLETIGTTRAVAEGQSGQGVINIYLQTATDGQLLKLDLSGFYPV